jgi:hypothetical protein
MERAPTTDPSIPDPSSTDPDMTDPSTTPGAVDPTAADASAPIPPMPAPSIDDASLAPAAESAPIATAAPDPTTASSAPAAEPAMMEANAAAMTAEPMAAEPVTAAPALAPRGKTKGVADIVFLVDVSGSMAPCIDALRRNIEVFVDSLSKGDANNAAPVKDWRGKVVGYRDLEHADAEGLPWIEDHPFVRDAVALKAQLGTLQAQGGGDEPESLLDALYTVASMPATPRGAQSEEPGMWRYRSDAARVVVVFTDASFKETLQIPAAKGGSLQDVANVVMANRIILSLFAPNFEGYDRLSQIDKSEWEVVEYEGLNAQQALQRYTADAANFRTTLKQLAASVSKSAETVAL